MENGKIKTGETKTGKRFTCLLPGLVVFVLLWLWVVPLQAAQVSAKLDRNRIVEGETVTLILQTDDPKLNLDADLSALENDFAVLDRRSETQMSIVNGRQSATIRLMLVLEPRRSGELLIPSLDVGGSKTRAIPVHVDSAPELEPGEAPPVFIEVGVTPEASTHYVNAQLGLTVRVYYQQNLTEAAISQPEPAMASVRLLDELAFQADRNGVRYRVLERHYAIFPERSGALTIPPLQLTGRLVERRKDRLWQPSVRGRRIQAKSEAIQLAIQPRPANSTGDSWLPARQLGLSEQLSASDGLRVGEPVTRTVIVDAVGLEENMISEPVWPELSNARIYPDQPQGISRDDGQWVLGHKEFRYAVVPEKAGELVLPELVVHWWDTVNDRQRTAVLPSRVIQVQPSAVMPLPPQTLVTSTAEAAGAPRNPGGNGGPGYWRWLAFLFAFLWLTTLPGAWRRRMRNTSPGSNRQAGPGEDESRLLKSLKQACNLGDTGQARRALGAWLDRFGPVNASKSLLDFAADLEDQSLRAGVYAMDADGFRPDSEGRWNSKQFWQQFEAWRKTRQATVATDKPPITDLYAKENRSG
ncbi:MAG: BatD family protein [Xanthomonadales bacterium]